METYVRHFVHANKTRQMTLVRGREALADELERWFIEGKPYALNVHKSEVWLSGSPIVVKSEQFSAELQDTLRAERVGAKVHHAAAVLEGDITYHTAFENLAGVNCASVTSSQIPLSSRLLLVAKMLESLATVHHGEGEWVLAHGDAHPRNFVMKGVLDFHLLGDKTEVVLVDLRNSQLFYPGNYSLNGSVSPLRDLEELLWEVKRTSGLCVSDILGLVETHYLPSISPLLLSLNLIKRLQNKLESPPKPERREVFAWGYD